MRTAVIIDDKNHAIAQIKYEFPKREWSNWNFVHFDTFEAFKKQNLDQIDVIFLDFFLSKDRIYGLDILTDIRSRFLVCFSSKKKMSDAMAKAAIEKGLYARQRVYSIQKLKESIENPKLGDVLTKIVSSIETPFGVDTFTITTGVLIVDVLVLNGTVQEPTAEELWVEVDEKLDRTSPRSLIIDFTEVTWLYEAGASRGGIFERAKERAQRGFGSVFVCNRDDDVYQSFILTGESSFIKLVKTVRQALDYLREDSTFRLPSNET